jgi:hypothetical protein
VGTLIPWAQGFKIADNQSPRPQDRLFFSFNYFDNLNSDINRRLGNTFSQERVYRETFGFEKTFLDGNASFGLRTPIDSINADSGVRGLGGMYTSVGDLTAFTKLILWKDEKAANLISTGLAVTVPNGPTAFGGAPYALGFHDTHIQPFLGYFFSRDRWYLQGFESIDVPFDPNDFTMLYSDIAVGYFVYKSTADRPLIRAIAPTFETHVNVPLNHQGVFRPNDPATFSAVVDLTFGLNVFLGRRSALSIGFVAPVTGPRPFSQEWTLLYNVYFGRSVSQLAPPTLIGN